MTKSRKRTKSAAVNQRSTALRRRRMVGEYPYRKAAVMLFCRECMGFEPGDTGSLKDAIRNCTSYNCWLWPYRLGPLDTSDIARAPSHMKRFGDE